MKYDYINSLVHSVKIYDDLEFNDLNDNLNIFNDDSDIEMNQMMINNFANSSTKNKNIYFKQMNIIDNKDNSQK